jgi:hypothetical protein
MGYRIFGLGYIYEILMCGINSQEAYRINLGIKSA